MAKYVFTCRMHATKQVSWFGGHGKSFSSEKKWADWEIQQQQHLCRRQLLWDAVHDVAAATDVNHFSWQFLRRWDVPCISRCHLRWKCFGKLSPHIRWYFLSRHHRAERKANYSVTNIRTDCHRSPTLSNPWKKGLPNANTLNATGHNQSARLHPHPICT